MKSSTAVVVGLLLTSLTVACGPSVTKATISQDKRDIEFKQHELEAAEAGLEPLEAYVEKLEKGTLPDGYFLMITAAEMRELGTQAYIPYSFPAKSFHKKISGTLITKEIKSIEILPSNKIFMQLLIKGQDISVNYKGDMYKPHVKKIAEGIEKGMLVDLTVSLTLKGGKVKAKARCRDVRLLKNNDSLYTSNIQTAINKALSKEAWEIPLPEKAGMKPVRIYTTENHVVIQYKW